MEIFAETKRLLLREIHPTDEQGMFELDSDSDVHRYLGNKPVNTIDEAKQVIDSIRKQYVQNGIGRWALIEKETEDFVGWCGLKLITEKINNHTHYYDLGYRLIRRYWGKGYASESAVASLEYGFNKLQLDTIYAMTDCENTSSKKVLLKIGLLHVETFEYQGVAHDWFKIAVKNTKPTANPSKMQLPVV